MSSKVSRGQGAMEYLMTYGWAILVVMVVGVAMWQLGVFQPPSGALTSTGFSKVKPLLAGSAFNGASGATNFMFTNGAGGTMRVQSVAIEDLVNPAAAPCVDGAALESNSADLLDGNADGTSVVVNQGENLRISNTGCLNTMTAGETFNARIRISYIVNVAGQKTPHTETGTLRGPVE